LVVIWWIASSGSQSTYFPPLEEILTVFREQWLFDGFTSDVLPSLKNLLLGVVAAVAIGVTIGVVVGSSDILWEIVRPAIEVGRSCPPLVLIPIVIGIFGIGSDGKVFLIFMGCLWPILVNSIDGSRSIPSEWLDIGATYRLSRKMRLTIRLRSASPQIMVGIRLAVAIGMSMVVASEMFAADRGIGHYLVQAQNLFNVRGVWAATILLGLIGYILTLIVDALDKLLVSWHHEMHARSGAESGSSRKQLGNTR